ncbi:MATA-HMG [Gigaspora margarita]|uniref:MATA-HMG n=1 Tax=Gigaspora margarita TaxID=4874 RepID=A0A8H4AUF0_GIGMA|nr:MATA-HMG [Gigaspora margarita]
MNKEYQSSFLVDTKPTPPSISPKINSRDLVILHPDGRVPKPPNAFIICRKLFVETARTNGYNLPMNIMFSMASQSWEQESNEKRNQWKTVSFDKPSTRKVRTSKPMKSINKSIKNKQLESPTVESELNLLPDANNLSNENSQILNLDLFADWANFFDNQNVYPSPDLSTIYSDYSPIMIEEFDFDLGTSERCFDLPIQQDQQVNEDIINYFLTDENQSSINESQYGLGIFDFSNNTLETIQIFDTQNVFNMVDETSYDQSLSTTINQDYLNDALISYDGFDYSL